MSTLFQRFIGWLRYQLVGPIDYSEQLYYCHQNVDETEKLTDIFDFSDETQDFKNIRFIKERRKYFESYMDSSFDKNYELEDDTFWYDFIVLNYFEMLNEKISFSPENTNLLEKMIPKSFLDNEDFLYHLALFGSYKFVLDNMNYRMKTKKLFLKQLNEICPNGISIGDICEELKEDPYFIEELIEQNSKIVEKEVRNRNTADFMLLNLFEKTEFNV